MRSLRYGLRRLRRLWKEQMSTFVTVPAVLLWTGLFVRVLSAVRRRLRKCAAKIKKSHANEGSLKSLKWFSFYTTSSYYTGSRGRRSLLRDLFFGHKTAPAKARAVNHYIIEACIDLLILMAAIVKIRLTIKNTLLIIPTASITMPSCFSS